MALTPGTRIGTYEVVGLLGAGGMGEVYRARDTTLGRDVALKILPDAFARDPERLARFTREAQTLAALNHPHIAQIHGFEEVAMDGPTPFDVAQGRNAGRRRVLVMELVEGEDLSRRIARLRAPGASARQAGMPLDEALPIAKQIAEALEAAHAQGIIHRDLKPANITVRADGTVKVLDFGLAKALDVNPASATADNSPTMTSPAHLRQGYGAAGTEAGMILGTAAYMAPEQARGKAVDTRADIWAFGCVLYEMITGRCAFGGETITDVLAAVVQKAPDWTALPAATPPVIRALLERCLEKDALVRLRDIGEARIALNRPQAVAHPRVVQTAAPPTRMRRALMGMAVVLVAIAAGLGGYVARPRDEPPTRKFHVAVRQDGARIQYPVISRDGRSVAYVANSRLWVQALDEWQPRELPGTDAAVRPFWSPSGDWIGYFRSEQLLKVPVVGGGVVSVARLPAVQAPLGSPSGAWGRDGSILISLAEGAVYRVPDTGGDPTKAFQPPEGVDALQHLSLLPDGGILALVHRAGSGGTAIGAIASGTLRILLETSSVANPRFSPSGPIIFERRSPAAALWAVPFSIDRLAVTGEPFLIGSGTEPSVADDGTLLFRAQPVDLALQLAWFSLDGRSGPVIVPPQMWREGIAVSPDGSKVVASGEDGIWMFDVATGARSRITRSASDISPRWVGTTGEIAFVRGESGTPDVVMKRADVGGDERVVAKGARFPSATADGRRLVFNARVASVAGQWEVAWIDLERPSEIHRLGAAHRGARFPDVSPDGRLVAYISGETGRDEIYLTQLPSGEGKWQLSTGGGGWTRFGRRGERVVYRALNDDVMSVAIGGQGGVTVGRPEKLFTWGSGWAPFYDLAPDGQRGIAAMPEGKINAVSSVSVVQNWHREFVARKK